MIDTSRNMLYHIGNLNTENQRISSQMATGKAIDKGSEDSILHSRLINLEDKLRITEGLKLQIDKSQALNNSADTSIGEIKLALESIKIDLMKGLNDGMDRSDKTALSSNLKGIRQNIIDRTNTQIDGEYLFAGSVTTKQTMVKDSDFELNGKVEFGGDGFLRKIAVQPGTYRDRGVTAYDVAFYNADTANAGNTLTFEGSDRIIDNSGNEWKLNSNGNRIQKYDYNGVLIEPKEEIGVSTPQSDSITVDLGVGLNTDAKGDYTIKIKTDSGTYNYTFTASGDSTAVAPPGPYTTSADEIFNATNGLQQQIESELSGPDQMFSVQRTGDSITITPLVDATISVEINDTDNNYDITATNKIEATASSTVDGKLQGGNKAIKGTYQLTVPSSLEGSVFEAKRNYFDDLNETINALDGYTTKLDGTRGGIASDDLVEDIIRDGLDITSQQFDATNVGHGELGGRNAVFEVAYDKILSQETNYNILIQEVGGADFAKLAMESKALEMTYQALYSTISKMNSLSLVNFVK
jgi:flagellar hook-associated protein 3 FlgL